MSLKNIVAISKKKERETNLRAKFRPPKEIKDYKPGALIERVMELTKDFESETVALAYKKSLILF